MSGTSVKLTDKSQRVYVVGECKAAPITMKFKVRSTDPAGVPDNPFGVFAGMRPKAQLESKNYLGTDYDAARYLYGYWNGKFMAGSPSYGHFNNGPDCLWEGTDACAHLAHVLITEQVIRFNTEGDPTDGHRRNLQVNDCEAGPQKCSANRNYNRFAANVDPGTELCPVVIIRNQAAEIYDIDISYDGQKGGPVKHACKDNAAFIDRFGWKCADYVGYDCSTFAEQMLYNPQEEDEMRANCPAACGLCSAS